MFGMKTMEEKWWSQVPEDQKQVIMKTAQEAGLGRNMNQCKNAWEFAATMFHFVQDVNMALKNQDEIVEGKMPAQAEEIIMKEARAFDKHLARIMHDTFGSSRWDPRDGVMAA